MKCEYGCGQDAKHQFKNGKWCCNRNVMQCLAYKKKISIIHKGRKAWNKGLTKEINSGMKKNSENNKKTWGNPKAKFKTKSFKVKRSIANKGSNNPMFGKSHPNKISISKIKMRYLFFFKIEEMRYNPDKPNKKEIQVHCKNHKCKNSKERGGWFTPTRIQIAERIRQLEDINGNGGSYFYCSLECKNICPLYGLKDDPFKDNNKILYTQSEYQQFREYVLKRDNYKCQYCSEKAEHVHHERPQKLEPFFALDPDLAWSVCKNCHYEKGHRDECSTGNLSKKRCI